MPSTELSGLVVTLRELVVKNAEEMAFVIESLQKRLEEEKMKPGQLLTELLLETAEESLKLIVELEAGNGDPNIIFAGSDLCELLGYMREELIGKPLSILLEDELKESHKAYVLNYADNPKDRRMGEGLKVKAKKKKGELIPVSILLKPKAKHDPTVVSGTRYYVIATMMPLES